MPPAWTDDLSGHSTEEILLAQNENRHWYKELRLRVNTLINSKLAKQIGSEEYSAGRKATTEEAAECRRRFHILTNEIEDRRREAIAAARYR